MKTESYTSMALRLEQTLERLRDAARGLAEAAEDPRSEIARAVAMADGVLADLTAFRAHRAKIDPNSLAALIREMAGDAERQHDNVWRLMSGRVVEPWKIIAAADALDAVHRLKEEAEAYARNSRLRSDDLAILKRTRDEARAEARVTAAERNVLIRVLANKGDVPAAQLSAAVTARLLTEAATPDMFWPIDSDEETPFDGAWETMEPRDDDAVVECQAHRDLGIRYLANRCTGFDANGEPETEPAVFKTRAEAERCWTDSLAAETERALETGETEGEA